MAALPKHPKANHLNRQTPHNTSIMQANDHLFLPQK